MARYKRVRILEGMVCRRGSAVYVSCLQRMGAMLQSFMVLMCWLIAAWMQVTYVQ